MGMGKQIMSLSQTLISIAALLFLMVANMALSQTTSFQIESFGDNPSDLTYQGIAYVPYGGPFLRLTGAARPSRRPSVGRVLYNQPVHFWAPGKQAEFETSIKFKITPTNNKPADGIAFFVAAKGSTIPTGSSNGNFGVFTSYGTAAARPAADPVFAVEIDTFINWWDPPFPHIGIDINSHTSSSFGYLDDSILGEEVNFTIKYDVAENTITAKAHVIGSKEYYEAAYQYDLSTLLPQEVQVGISASTGRSVTFQDIYSWSFTSNMITVDDAGIRKVVST